jgi:outer membrane immunogenic protein
MKMLLLAGIAFAAVVGPATAADLARPVHRKPVVVAAPVYTWTGCYLGGHVGGGSAIKALNGPLVGAFPAAASVPPTSGTIGLTDDTIDFDSNAFLGGGQVGCNYQFASNWVTGIEGDASWTRLRANKLQIGSATETVATMLGNATLSANSTGILSWETNVIGTLTGRLGYASDRWMIYSKGGAAWARDKYSLSGQLFSATHIGILLLGSNSSLINFNAAETRLGWTLGGGIECAFWDNWSVKVEYDYLDFGRRAVTFTDPIHGAANVDITQRINEVKLGLNYRFGNYYTPVVTK